MKAEFRFRFHSQRVDFVDTLTASEEAAICSLTFRQLHIHVLHTPVFQPTKYHYQYHYPDGIVWDVVGSCVIFGNVFKPYGT